MKYLVWENKTKMVVKTEGIKEARQEAFMCAIENKRPIYIGAQNDNRITAKLNDRDQNYRVTHKSLPGGRIAVGIVDTERVLGYLDRDGNIVRRPIAYTKDEAYARYRR